MKAQEKIMTWQDTELGQKERKVKELEKRLAEVEKEKKTHEVIEIDNDDEYGMRHVKQEPKGETSKGFKLEDVNPSLLKWIPGYEAKKKEKDSESQHMVEETAKPSVYIPKTRPDKTVVLVENVGVKSTDRRSGRTVPLP